MNKTIFFMIILLLAGFVSADAGNAFPQEEAGISAYVNVGESINLKDATSAYTQMLNISQTHAIGTIPISSVHTMDNIHMYVDVNGWIVAYLKRNEQTARMIQWADINTSNPVFERTTLTDAIEEMCSSLGINYTTIKDDIQYYDFEYPDADKLKIFTTIKTSAGDTDTNIFIPDTYTLYETSYSFKGCSYRPYDHHLYSSLYIDGVCIATTDSHLRNFKTCGEYGNRLSINKSHTIRLNSYIGSSCSFSGVANILIYS